MIVDKWDKVPDNARGVVDVWWLVDDGGLTLLVPWLIASKRKFAHCSLRILAVPSSITTVARDVNMMRELVKEFRIDAEVMAVTPDEVDVAPAELRRWIDSLPFAVDSGDLARCERYLLLSRLMELYSSDSVAVFVSMPFPRPEIGNRTWLSWLALLIDTLDRPICFIRGDQKDSLSFYV
eukprot:TRINITY_DN1399_c0_g1_i1.p1 TRINITY_DN1399_c0_g1~~TRINITY_DN1399_c0_g1_i1.p1  ORF type:complete len:180 (-),score=105.02 TRINITY_DN1399_c0_g1_i1:36-575(-)